MLLMTEIFKFLVIILILTNCKSLIAAEWHYNHVDIDYSIYSFPQISDGYISFMNTGCIQLYDGKNILNITKDVVPFMQVPVKDMSGSNVAWVGYGSPVIKNQLFIYKDGVTVQLTNNQYPNNFNYNPSISGQEVVWSETDGNDTEIFYYNGSDISQLTNNDVDDVWPKISKRTIAWLQKGDGHIDNVMYYDGQQAVNLSENNEDEYISKPVVSNGYVAWIEDSYGYSDVFMFDGNDKVKVTNDNHISKRDIDIFNNRLVWIGEDHNNFARSDIYYYDGDVIHKITDDSTDEQNATPQIFGDTFIWRSIVYNSLDDDDAEIFFFNGSNVVQLTDDLFDQRNHDISNGYVLWATIDTDKSNQYLEIGKLLYEPNEINSWDVDKDRKVSLPDAINVLNKLTSQ